LTGYFSETVDDPGYCKYGVDERFVEAETRGRPDSPLSFELTARAENLAVFFEDQNHELGVRGKVEMRLPGTKRVRRYAVDGHLHLFVKRHKPYALDEDHPHRRAFKRMGVEYRSRVGEPDVQRFMKYHLELVVEGRRWALSGYKRLRDDAGIDAWRDASHLFVRVFEGLQLRGIGTAHVDLNGFLFKQLPSIRVGHVRDGKFTPTTDPAQAVWAAGKFAVFFFGTLQRIYVPEVRTALGALFAVGTDNVQRR
jgi:hypothetical protein